MEAGSADDVVQRFSVSSSSSSSKTSPQSRVTIGLKDL